jgi:hypothetical protein
MAVPKLKHRVLRHGGSTSVKGLTARVIATCRAMRYLRRCGLRRPGRSVSKGPSNGPKQLSDPATKRQRSTSVALVR